MTFVGRNWLTSRRTESISKHIDIIKGANLTWICSFYKDEKGAKAYLCSTKSLNGRGNNEGADDPIAHDSGQIAHESNPGDALHIPAKGDFLQAHDNHSGRTSDD